MPDTPETIIEEIRTDAATEAVQSVASVAATGDAIIASEVAQVGDELAEHAEASEERHTEILEGESWIRNSLEQLSMTLSTLLSLVTANHAATMAEIQALKTVTESTGSRSSNPPEAVIAVVEPPVAEVVPEVPVTPEPEVKKRTRRPI